MAEPSRLPVDWVERAIAELQGRALTKPCFQCESRDYSIESTPHVLMATDNGGRQLESRGLLLAAVVCKNCGHTSLFSLKHLGVTVD